MSTSKSRGAREDERPATTYRIHPGVGIARAGDSEEDFFVGPEAPAWRPRPDGGYKDAAGRVKRQAARFRIYEYGADGKAIREVSAFDAKIEWTVHLANKKAAWFDFVGRYKWEDPAKRLLRNPAVQGGPEYVANPDLRTELIIDPGERCIAGAHRGPVAFDTGAFRGTPVPLGELRTDSRGALLVLGGHGKSASVTPENPVKHYANNNDWYDDLGDGPVSATVTLKDGTSFTADPAWVIVAPPKFAPNLDDVVTLDELLRELYVKQRWLPEVEGVEFARDILPLLTRAADNAWVNATAYRGHGAGAGGNFLEPQTLAQLRSPDANAKSARQLVFSLLRAPAATVEKKLAKKQASLNYMPLLAGDGGEPKKDDPRTWLTLLASQYEHMRKWAAGEFTDANPEGERPRPLDLLPVQQRPEALDRGALQPCVGGPLYPGIEMTFIADDPATWRAPYRIAESWRAGDVSRWMAVPWQADFFECMTHWWPATRPDDVLPQAEYESALDTWAPPPDPATDEEDPKTAFPFAAATAYRAPWARGLPSREPAGDNAMVKYWSELGFVVPVKAPSGERVYVERERLPIVGLDPRELFHKLMNVDEHPEVLPKARAYTEHVLADARARQHHPDTPEIWRPFEFSPETFQARMLETYRLLVEQASNYEPENDAVCRSAADVEERIRQFAPFNMTDGAWLHNISRAGPFDATRALLFSVLMDEAGDGEVAHNHCNIYRDLCHTIGFYPPDITSEEFAYSPQFLDSAFEVPAFELAISQFSEDYFPELLGMTLQLELTVVQVKTTIALIKHYGFDAHYWEMHVGIDNPLTGHAAKAIQAIIAYLENIRANAGGPEAMALAWQRIWNGWIAFGTYGTFSADLRQHIRHRPTLKQQVIAMIESKAPFGSMNHDMNEIEDVPINDWFLDPKGFMQALVNAGYFIAGDPDNSPFFELTSFQTGRMYKVFTEEELKLWADWCRSLGQPKPPPPPPPDHYGNMVKLTNVLRWRQGGSQGHKTALLRRPGSEEAFPVAWWFEQRTRDFLEALAWPQNEWVKPGEPDASPFVTERLAPSQPMGKAFADPVPGLGGRTGRDVAVAWIAAGCPVPPPARTLENLWLATSKSAWDAHPTHQLLGMAAVH
jgi:L-Lysine epsilon oxidase N-terminal/L-lysine epsilon oxidase C-terminal domain/Iron-containing redox enzyme